MKTKCNILAFLVIGILGTLGHFVYDWSGQAKILGYFFATNESTWEHLKLLFFPTIIYSLFEFKFSKEKFKNYTGAVTISLIFGLLSIITLFYTYSGVLGFTVDFINIAIFYISLVIMLIVKNKILKSGKFSNNNLLYVFICFVIALLFIFFTYNPPQIALFEEPKI